MYNWQVHFHLKSDVTLLKGTHIVKATFVDQALSTFNATVTNNINPFLGSVIIDKIEKQNDTNILYLEY